MSDLNFFEFEIEKLGAIETIDLDRAIRKCIYDVRLDSLYPFGLNSCGDVSPSSVALEFRVSSIFIVFYHQLLGIG